MIRIVTNTKMEESGPDTSDRELFGDEDLVVTLTTELDEAYQALGKTAKDVLEAPGKITIRKVLMVVHSLLGIEVKQCCIISVDTTVYTSYPIL